MDLNNDSISLPECPISFEVMTPDIRIAQCLSGPLLCWSCKEKLEVKKCPSYSLAIDGRCFGITSRHCMECDIRVYLSIS